MEGEGGRGTVVSDAEERRRWPLPGVFYVPQKSHTALDASRQERKFIIGKSCESPQLKGVPFIKRMLFNHLAQRWVQAPTEQGSLRQLGLVQAQQTLESDENWGEGQIRKWICLAHDHDRAISLIGSRCVQLVTFYLLGISRGLL